MSKHTPGPWKIVPRTRPFQMTISVESVNPRGYIARCIDAGTLGTPNAHLIAAAPDLLEALQNAPMILRPANSAWEKQYQEWTDTALAAIAKAVPNE